ncbi:MAG: hypothetical protein ACKVJ7_01165 [Candidatus Poseidoniales archaeon]|jgi:hypothetical protein
MPGSPYLKEPPPGLITWPKLLLLVTPALLTFSAVALWQNLLKEWLALLTIVLLLTFLLRR